MRGLFILRYIQHVSDSAHGVDHFYRKFVVDFAAQMADIDVDDIGQAIVIDIPNMLDDHGAAEWSAAVAHHVLEDAEFLWRELDVIVAARHLTSDAIQAEIAYLQPLGRGLSRRKSTLVRANNSTNANGLTR